MKAKLIELNDWERVGGGGNGWSYFHKTDDSIMLKLNKESISEEEAYIEYFKSKAVYEMGIKCPEVYDFVTDGIRFGYTVQKIKHKKSFARIISEDPSQLEPLAKEFARQSKEFHSIKCDTENFYDYGQHCRELIMPCPHLPQDAKEILLSIIDSFNSSPTPIHGDLNPGNLIKAEGVNYWIDLGEFAYGNPDYDLQSMLFLSRYTPKKITEYLFHITAEQCEEFMQIYGREFYGDVWDSEQMKDRLDKLARLKAGLAVVKSEKSAKLYLPLVYGQKFKFGIIKLLANLLIRTYN